MRSRRTVRLPPKLLLMMVAMIPTVLMTLMVTVVVVVVLMLVVIMVVVVMKMTMKVMHDGLPLSIAMWQGIATPILPTRRNPTAQRHDRCIGGTHPSALHPPPMRHQIPPRQAQTTTTTTTMTTMTKGWDTIGRLRCLPFVQPTRTRVRARPKVVVVLTAAAAAVVVLVAAFERAD